MANTSLQRLITYAFQINSPEFISGLPSWTESTRFDIQAKVDEDKLETLSHLSNSQVIDDQYVMLRQMIMERFKLRSHKVGKNFPAYSLVLTKGGTKLKQAAHHSPSEHSKVHDGELSLYAVPVAILVHELSIYSGRQVVDQTGLNGDYDIALKWTPQSTLEKGEGVGAELGPSLFTALIEQLGLRLIPSSPIKVDTMMVDSVSMPTEN